MYWCTAAKCYLYLENCLCAGSGFLVVKLRPRGSFFRGKTSRRGSVNPTVAWSKQCALSRRRETVFFRSSDFYYGEFQTYRSWENKVMSPHMSYVPNKTTISVCPILFLLITPLSAIILKKILCIVLFKYVSLKDKDSLKNTHCTIISP